VVDLYVYALKYQTFLADTDSAVLPETLPPGPEGTRSSDGPDGLERLLAVADLSCLDTDQNDPIADLVDSIQRTFADLEACFTNAAQPAPTSTRAKLAAKIANQVRPPRRSPAAGTPSPISPICCGLAQGRRSQYGGTRRGSVGHRPIHVRVAHNVDLRDANTTRSVRNIGI
jgi:hypothetical protein